MSDQGRVSFDSKWIWTKNRYIEANWHRDSVLWKLGTDHNWVTDVSWNRKHTAMQHVWCHWGLPMIRLEEAQEFKERRNQLSDRQTMKRLCDRETEHPRHIEEPKNKIMHRETKTPWQTSELRWEINFRISNHPSFILLFLVILCLIVIVLC